MQINDTSFLNTINIISSGQRVIKVPNSYSAILNNYWLANLPIADIEIIDCDEEDDRGLILDSNKVLNQLNLYSHDQISIKMPSKQVSILKNYYLNNFNDQENKTTDFILDNSLELYCLKEENKSLKTEIERLKYLLSKKQ